MLIKTNYTEKWSQEQFIIKGVRESLCDELPMYSVVDWYHQPIREHAVRAATAAGEVCEYLPGREGIEARQSGQALAGEMDRVRFDTQQVDTGGKCVGMRLELFYYYYQVT
jgi:hypothetical protein